MTTRIEISTRRYESVFGRKPSGYRLWYFQLPGGRVFTYTGEFGSACRAATDHVRDVYSAAPIFIQVAA